MGLQYFLRDSLDVTFVRGGFRVELAAILP
jgi:hypothetical protein